MNNYNKEKVNMFFLVVLLSIFIFYILYEFYEKEVEDFKNHNSEILKRYDKVRDINNYLTEFNLSYSVGKIIGNISDENIDKHDNNTFSYDGKVYEKNIYVIGELDENGDFLKNQIEDINHVLKFMEIFRNISTKYKTFEYCFYVSNNNFSSIFPYDGSRVDNVYFRNLLSNIDRTSNSTTDLYHINSDKGLMNKIWISVDYLEKYDEFFEIICIDYSYKDVYRNFGGKVYFAFKMDPKLYLNDGKYESYIIYTDYKVLYDEDDNIKFNDVDGIPKQEEYNEVKQFLEYMINTNAKEEVFKGKNNYYKASVLSLSNNIILSRVSKTKLLWYAISSAKMYILILLVSLIGFILYLVEWRLIKKLTYLSSQLEKTNNRLKMVDKIDYSTGLLNRNSINEYANEIQKLFYVIIVSLDGAKYINEFYGYEIADKIIVSISKVLISFFEKQHKIIKWSGKDYMIFYYGKYDEDIVMLCEELNDDISRLIVTDNIGDKVNFSVSIGISKKANYNDGFVAIKEAERTIEYLRKKGNNNILTFEEMEKIEQ